MGGRIDIGCLPGQELFKAEHEDGGGWAEIATVSNDYGNLWVELELRLHNRFEERLLFDMEDVRLSYQGEDYPARPIGLRGESGISIRGKNWIKERWKFEIGTWVDAGVYDVTLKNLRVLRDSKPVPVDLGLTFPLRVPGEKPLDSGC
ncbi:MAG: hypothetical protein DWP92_04150 [Armatimonadetes bacterium]|nr:MAG: hypothetical protein DWP92_04150 [Armatimonadota bacterium]